MQPRLAPGDDFELLIFKPLPLQCPRCRDYRCAPVNKILRIAPRPPACQGGTVLTKPDPQTQLNSIQFYILLL